MFLASPRILKILAALVWYTGGISLALKAWRLLDEATALRPESYWPILAIAIGLFVGGIKTKYLFDWSCKKNLKRIDALEKPRIWLFFRPWFFLALALMITTGVILSQSAHGNFPFLIGVGAMDVSLATALTASGRHFFKSF